MADIEKIETTTAFIPEGAVTAGQSSEIQAATDQVPFYQKVVQSPPQIQQSKLHWKTRIMRQAEEVNKELWLIFSMFLIMGVMNYLMSAHRMLLGFYTLPTLFSAYFYGRRHAVLTAFASIFLVGLVVHFNPSLFTNIERYEFVEGRWYDITAWSSILVITAYTMGTLYERNEARIQELQQTYKGLMVILRHFISKDTYTENHCYRVSIYSAKIAEYLGFDADRIEDTRAAALLHDIGKLDISRNLLYKAAQLTKEEFEGIKRHVDKGVEMLEPVGGPLGRIIPIILSHHDKYDGSGYHTVRGEEILLEARVLAVADVYDSLVSDRPYRKAMSPFEAREVIVKGAQTEFDPRVVEAFLKAFGKGEMEVPNLVI